MHTHAVVAALVAAGSTAAALAQATYTFEYRIIADGTAGAPSGGWTQFPIGDPASTSATQIGFWVQARVLQIGAVNYGIARASSPPGGTPSYVTISDGAGASTLSRGRIGSSTTAYGRGPGYRVSGVPTGATGNTPESEPFPGIAGNDNGAIDSGSTRIYGFDCYMGVRRSALTDVDGNLINPWGINASTTPGSVPEGEFSPWANLYRFYAFNSDLSTERDVMLNSRIFLNGVQLVRDEGEVFAILYGEGTDISAAFTYHVVPTPSSAAIGVLAFTTIFPRRRRRLSVTN